VGLVVVDAGPHGLDTVTDLTSSEKFWIKRCYDASQDVPARKKTMLVQLEIDGAGRVLKSDVIRSEIADQTVQDCVRNIASHQTFPAFGQGSPAERGHIKILYEFKVCPTRPTGPCP
jgi:hypothetical protein